MSTVSLVTADFTGLVSPATVPDFNLFIPELILDGHKPTGSPFVETGPGAWDVDFFGVVVKADILPTIVAHTGLPSSRAIRVARTSLLSISGTPQAFAYNSVAPRSDRFRFDFVSGNAVEVKKDDWYLTIAKAVVEHAGGADGVAEIGVYVNDVFVTQEDAEITITNGGIESGVIISLAHLFLEAGDVVTWKIARTSGSASLNVRADTATMIIVPEGSI